MAVRSYHGDVESTEELRVALRSARVAVAWLFGSRAVGAARRGSDIDVAVLTADDAPPLALLDLAELTRVLEELLAAPVDLIDFRRAPLELQAGIVTTGRLLHSDDEALRVRTVVTTQSRWEDVRPALRTMDRAYLAAVAERGLLASGPAGRP